MCVIVDANLAAEIFGGGNSKRAGPVLRWIGDPKRDGCLVYGGHLAIELARVAGAARYLAGLSRAGRARLIPDPTIDSEQARVRQLGCTSDDPHVLALARTSGARTLCTEDRALQRDFKNPALIAKPRGSIYSKAEHTRLLRHSRSCGRLKRTR